MKKYINRMQMDLNDVNQLVNFSHIKTTLKPTSAEPMAQRQRLIEKVDFVASLMKAENERARQAQMGLNVFRVENLVRQLGGLR